MRSRIWYLIPDIVAIVVFGIVLIVLSERNLLEPIMRYPMLVVIACYYTGRIVSAVQFRLAAKSTTWRNQSEHG